MTQKSEYIEIPLEWFNPFHWIQKGTDKLEEGITKADESFGNEIGAYVGGQLGNAIVELATNVWNWIVLYTPELVGGAALFCGGTMIIMGLMGKNVTRPLGVFAAALTIGTMIQGAN